ncbi:MAG: hypothetical protein ABIK89_07830 [Planctomycetota bacterium]
MTRPTYAAVLLAMCLFLAGCAGDYEVASDYGSGGNAPPPSEQAAPPTTDSPPAAPSAPESTPASSPGDEVSGGPPASPPPPAPVPPAAAGPPATVPMGTSRQPSIKLSAGVALPQSLPTGTAMGFSADYRFTGGRPSPSSRYFWVIEPAKGEPVRMEVKLNDEGTLPPTFVPSFRPENGPFRTHVEDGYGNRLSPSLPLR